MVKRKIDYIDLQKKYAGKVVLLNQAETKVLATGKTGPEIMRKIKEKGLEKIKFVIEGPIAKPSAINVYISICHKAN